MRTAALTILLLTCLAACACSSGNQPAAHDPSMGGEPAPLPEPVAKDKLKRSEVVATVDQGLGRFLQHVEVEPSLAGGRFVGFRIVGLRPAEYWAGVDLMPGDVVTRVNGRSIERDTDAYKTFQSLKSATELRVTFMRGGQERELVLPIVDDGVPPATKKQNKIDAG